jgi:hypothetical protein
MCWLGNDNPAEIRAIGEMAGVEYFIMLDKKIANTKKQIQNARKNGKK